MRNKLLVMGVCWTIALVPASALQAGPNGEVCRQIVFACLDAGFIQGGAKRGNGLWMNCISPIMQGKGLQRASMPLPRLSPRVVSACRASNPTFGQPKARERYVTQGIVRPATPANDGSEITLPDKKPAVPVVPKASEPAVGTSDVAPQTDGDVKMATQPGLGKPDGAATAKHAIVADQDAAPSSSNSSGYTQTLPAPANADAADLKMTTQTAALDPKKTHRQPRRRLASRLGVSGKRTRCIPYGETCSTNTPPWWSVCKRAACWGQTRSGNSSRVLSAARQRQLSFAVSSRKRILTVRQRPSKEMPFRATCATQTICREDHPAAKARCSRFDRTRCWRHCPRQRP